MINFENIVIFGDIHGIYDELIKFMKKYDIRNSAFISVGDFGIFNIENNVKEYKQLSYYDKIIKNRNNKIYVSRGNHDNPKYFIENLNIGNIEFLPDYTVLNLNGYNFLNIGGAISIDRKPNKNFFNGNFNNTHKGRTLDKDYWIDENVIYSPDKLMNLSNIDVVITHSAPHFCPPMSKQGIKLWAEYDKELYNDVFNERDNLSKIYIDLIKNNNNIKYWFYGHYHFDNVYEQNNIKFVLLGANKFYELKF